MILLSRMAEKPTPRKMASLTTVSILAARLEMRFQRGCLHSDSHLCDGLRLALRYSSRARPLGDRRVEQHCGHHDRGGRQSRWGGHHTGWNPRLCGKQPVLLRLGGRHIEQQGGRYGAWVTSAGVAITPDGTRAYVANSNSSSVSVIQTSSNTVVATISVAKQSLWGWPSHRTEPCLRDDLRFLGHHQWLRRGDRHVEQHRGRHRSRGVGSEVATAGRNSCLCDQ